MALNRILVDAPREAVFDVLLDPASYRIWVVGSKRIRAVDAGWPEVGTRFHHTVGFGPFETDDSTELLAVDRPSGLTLRAQAWPFGTARVTILLEPRGDGTLVTLREEPLDGPAKRLDNPAMQRLLWARNVVALRRLKDWAEQRHRSTPGLVVER